MIAGTRFERVLAAYETAEVPLLHPANRNDMIRTCDLLVPNQAP